MANPVPFDTLAYAKKLEAGGVQAKQAEAHAETLAEVLEVSFITKKDSDIAINNLAHEINILRTHLEHEISTLRNEMKEEINKLRSEMREEINGLRSEMRGEINGLRSEMREEINGLRSEMREEINGLRSEIHIKIADLKTEIAGIKSEVIKWVFGISFAQAALIISVLKFFH